MAQAKIGAEEQEETERRSRGVEQLPALFVSGDGGARLRLVNARDRVGNSGGSSGDAFEPSDKATKTLGVGRARVLSEARRLPGGSRTLDVIGSELRWGQGAEIF